MLIWIPIEFNKCKKNNLDIKESSRYFYHLKSLVKDRESSLNICSTVNSDLTSTNFYYCLKWFITAFV